MDRKEQEILERIREQSERTKIPESLRPEAVRERLEHDPLGKPVKKYRRRMYQAGSVAAACLVLAAGILIWGGRTDEKPGAEVHTKDHLADTGNKLRAAKDSEEIYAYMETDAQSTGEAQMIQAREGAVLYETKEKASTSSESAADAGSSAAARAEDYSRTNLRQQGVDEGDVAKTDGRYLYVCRDDRHTAAIVDTKDGLKKAAEIELEPDEYICELYITDGKLVLITAGQDTVSAVIYDVTDPGAPKEQGKVTQSGAYQSSRMAEGYLYLFTQYYVDTWAGIDPGQPRTYMPVVNDTVMKETDIFLPQTDRANMYEVITSVDLHQPDQALDSKALLSKGGELYVGSQNIYYYETLWESAGTVTAVRKIAYEDGKLKAVCQGSFDGYLNDSFSIDEHEGCLRVVTTVDDTNSVYILDEKLNEIGAIEGLAREERIYSARFMGDTAYFVTFKETDPLFSVDLSDPEHPSILGALKIPGFSEYLHDYGDGLLLGIGMDVDEDTQITEGVKLTMFDVTDPENVKEADTYVLDYIYHTDVFADYKAVLADPEKNLIGFSGYGEGGQLYLLFDYDEDNGFRCRMEEEINGSGAISARGIYIGQTIYVIQGNIIEAYSLENEEKTEDLIL